MSGIIRDIGKVKRKKKEKDKSSSVYTIEGVSRGVCADMLPLRTGCMMCTHQLTQKSVYYKYLGVCASV